MTLPTPMVSDYKGDSPGVDGFLQLRAIDRLLPTPVVNDMGEGKTVEWWDEWTEEMRRKHNNNGHGASLSIEARSDGFWGKYEPAVRQWELTLGHLAPDPTDDKGRLNPVFAEWMMGWPNGYTEPLSRRNRLKVLGNGVVPQQAHAAFDQLFARVPAPQAVPA